MAQNSAAEKSDSAKGGQAPSEGGQKFLPPNPLPFCPPERSVFCSAFGGAISRSFVQKRFELRSVIATNLNIANFAGSLFARSPRRSLSRTAMRERVSLRKKPCISELNRRVGQIQIQFFGKANGGSRAKHAINKVYFQFFPFRQRRNTKQVF